MKPALRVVMLASLCIAVVGRSAEPSSSITLEGTLLVGDFYGPPDYGDNPGTDHIEHSLFLQLPASPKVQLADSTALDSFGAEAQRTYFVQIVTHDAVRPTVKQAIGHNVQVTGVPFAPQTGHHRTALLIDVKTLKPIDAWRW